MSVQIEYCCEVLNGKAFVLGGETIIALLDTNTFAIKEINLPHEASNVSCIDEQQIVIFMPQERLLLNANLSSSDIELGTSSVIPVEHDWTRLVRKGTQYIMCTETAVFIYSLKWEKLGTISHFNNRPLFTVPRNRSFFYDDDKDDNNICDVVVEDNIIIIASQQKLVVTDNGGNIKKTFKPGGNVTRFNDSFLFVCGKGKINIVKDTGKFMGILIQDRWLHFKDCIHYGQICERLLVSNSKEVKIFRVQ